MLPKLSASATAKLRALQENREMKNRAWDMGQGLLGARYAAKPSDSTAVMERKTAELKELLDALEPQP